MKKLGIWLGFVAASLAAGFVGSFFTAGAVDGWYTTLTRPELAPPNWVFGPVWTVLYVLMGTAAFLVWKKGWQRPLVKVALFMFVVQLILNSLWSIIYFGWQELGWAMLEIVVLWTAIMATIVCFARVSRLAAWLLVPYLAWVSFAAYLNFMFWTLNM